MHYLNQEESKRLDELLLSDAYGFSLAQLMELAGLAVAQAINEFYPVQDYGDVLVLCGPGNNGGDGLVAARHLASFGYRVQVYAPLVKPLLQVLSLLT